MIKNIVLSTLLLIPTLYINAQNLDLIVTSEGDSLAVRIDSVTVDEIYFNFKKDGIRISTKVALSRTLSYSTGTIDRKKITPIPGTIFFRTKPTEELKLAKNTIHAGVGFFFIYGYSALNYERLIAYKPSDIFKRLYIRGSGGGWIFWGLEGTQFSLSIAALTGKSNSHVEASLGLTVLLESGYRDTYVSPYLGVGYRYQKPGGGFIFRTGIGVPETIYLGLGYAF